MIHGLLLLNKPEDCTSHDVVAKVRKVLGQKSVGHTGTLDPMASGLMILVLGEATKLSDYLTAEDKEYELELRLGATTDTLDRTGQILSEKPVNLPSETVLETMRESKGEFQWPVPIFSAKRVDGEKLYEKARRGDQGVELPTKSMCFEPISVASIGGNHFTATLACSKGSFVRTWVDQLGQKLGVGACLWQLKRRRVGPWNLDNAVELKALLNLDLTKLTSHPSFLPLSRALPGVKSILAGPKEERLVLNGQIPKDIANRLVFEQRTAQDSGEPVLIQVLSMRTDLLAILAAEAQQGLKIRRVFRTNP